MTYKNKILTLSIVFGIFSFLFNYSIQSYFDRYDVLDQIDVMFSADTAIKLDSFVNGLGREGQWRVVHPNLANYFYIPIRFATKIITYFRPENKSQEIRIRRIMALFVVPIFSAFNAMAITLIFSNLYFPLLEVCILTTLSIFAFTQLIYGSMPESFALNGFFITVCFLFNTILFNSKRISWGIWIVTAVFGMGITITNIVIFILIFFIYCLFKYNDINLSIKNTILLVIAATFFTFFISIGSSLLFGKKPSLADIKGAAQFTERHFSRVNFLEKGSKYPVAVVSSITPIGIKILDNPGLKNEKKWGGKYHHSFRIDSNDIGRSSIILIIFITICITFIGFFNLLRNGPLFQSLAISSILILIYNWLFHSFWGGTYFLYSQHWICALIILISGVFLTKRPFLMPIRLFFLAFLIYVIYKNLATLNYIFHFLRNYSS